MPLPHTSELTPQQKARVTRELNKRRKEQEEQALIATTSVWNRQHRVGDSGKNGTGNSGRKKGKRKAADNLDDPSEQPAQKQPKNASGTTQAREANGQELNMLPNAHRARTQVAKIGEDSGSEDDNIPAPSGQTSAPIGTRRGPPNHQEHAYDDDLKSEDGEEGGADEGDAPQSDEEEVESDDLKELFKDPDAVNHIFEQERPIFVQPSNTAQRPAGGRPVKRSNRAATLTFGEDSDSDLERTGEAVASSSAPQQPRAPPAKSAKNPGSSHQDQSLTDVRNKKRDSHSTKRSRSSRRKEKYDNEKPQFIADNPGPSDESTAGVGPIRSSIEPEPCDPETDLIVGETGLQMTQQRTWVYSTLEAALVYIYGSLLFDNAFPESSALEKSIRDALALAADDIADAGEVGQRIRHRLKWDKRYMRTLAKYIRGRIAQFRRLPKDSADKTLQRYYPVTAGDRNGVIERLMRNHRYIYPGDLDTRIDKDRAYRHPFIVQLLSQTYFQGRSPVALGVQEWFKEAAVRGRYEIPLPMLALTATAVCASLDWWKRGCPKERPHFSGSIFGDVYRTHIYMIKQIIDDKPKAYRKLMTDLFDEASNGLLQETAMKETSDMLDAAAEMDIENMEELDD
ncbi:hypothetical protein PLICRDRAFT_178914 [Plicaturopsis crispa FD-325 SS-3]|uniref:DUF6532 domain-containing protein n=1 Tax=Plicaturopsis crispa FD-325 SS-3 TaxID=944288 RepID=A0A0C9T787_PLICR|nr:hypothetical protein PLICRDRAFT_178914 [Plicaturopsis crispa FD-325 SS-3]